MKNRIERRKLRNDEILNGPSRLRVQDSQRGRFVLLEPGQDLAGDAHSPVVKSYKMIRWVIPDRFQTVANCNRERCDNCRDGSRNDNFHRVVTRRRMEGRNGNCPIASFEASSLLRIDHSDISECPTATCPLSQLKTVSAPPSITIFTHQEFVSTFSKVLSPYNVQWIPFLSCVYDTFIL